VDAYIRRQVTADRRASPDLEPVLERLDEIGHQISRLSGNGRDMPGAELVPLGDDLPDALTVEAGPGLEQVDENASANAEENEGANARPTDGLTRSRTLREIVAHPENVTPPEPVVPGLAWRGRITLVSAREGVGKSTLFAAAAAAVTTGGTFLGGPCLTGPVVWVLIEEALPDLALRAIRFQTDADLLHVLERPEVPLASLIAEVDRWMPALVVVDTLHRFASAERHAARSRATDASASEAWSPLMVELDRIARRSNAAVVLSAQAVKASGEYRDSSEIGHGVDVVLNLIRPDKTSPVRRLEKDKSRFTVDEVLTFELAGDTYRLGGTVAKKLSKQRQRVLDALEPPMTYSEWLEASEGVPARTFDRAIKVLVDQGYVSHAEDGTYRHNRQSTATPRMAVEPVGPPFRSCAESTSGGGTAPGGETGGTTGKADDGQPPF
jgi:hypothetical protein